MVGNKEILFFIGFIIIIILFSVMLYLITRKTSTLTKEFKKLDNFIILLYILLLSLSIFSIILDIKNISSNLLLSIFMTLGFSLQLTKKIVQLEFEKKQEKLAELSHRHLCDIELLLFNLRQCIEEYNIYNRDDYKCFLRTLLREIEDIQNGVKSNEADLGDMLSVEYKEKLRKNQTLILAQKIEEKNPEIKASFVHYFNYMNEEVETVVVADEEIATKIVGGDYVAKIKKKRKPYGTK